MASVSHHCLPLSQSSAEIENECPNENAEICVNDTIDLQNSATAIDRRHSRRYRINFIDVTVDENII